MFKIHPFSNFCHIFLCVFVLILTPYKGSAQITFSDATADLNNSSLLGSHAMGISDLNGDGLDDLIRTSGGQIELEYQSIYGSWTRKTYSTGISTFWSVCVGDLSDNGYNDLFFGAISGSQIILNASNDGNSHAIVALNPGFFAQASNMVDIDNDGDLDLFVCDDDSLSKAYRNDGSGNMILDTSLIAAYSTVPSDNSGNYGSVWTDYDNDGDLDLYISKCRQGVLDPYDGRRINQLFQNDGNGNFTDVGVASGLVPYEQSWAADFADVDNDGDLDAFVANHTGLSQLYFNNGSGIYSPSGDTLINNFFAGNFANPYECFFEDMDNNGFVDLIVGNLTKNGVIFWNQGGDFVNATYYGDGNGHYMIAAATGDLNHDGFPDLMTSFSGSSGVPGNDRMLLNNGNSNHFLNVSLKGITSNPNGIGARLELYGAWGKQIREIHSGQSYGICNSLTAHFGTGSYERIDSLIVRWPSGETSFVCAPSVDQFIIVTEGLSNSVIGDFDFISSNLDVQFTQNYNHSFDSIIWKYGDGQTDSILNPSTTYSYADTFEVCLEQYSSCLAPDTTCKFVILDTFEISCSFGYSQNSLNVTFMDSSVSIPGIKSWYWQFGDGSNSTHSNPGHLYGAPGFYNVCLTVTDWNNESKSHCATIYLTCPPPTANFNMSITNRNITLTNSSTFTTFPTYSWSLGDSSTSNNVNIIHEYAEEGTYPICLVAQDVCGVDTFCINADIICPLPATNFDFTNNNRHFSFTDVSPPTTGITNYLWEFGDGTTSSGFNLTNVSHSYFPDGNYNVCLFVTDQCGTKDTCKPILVTCSPAIASFNYTSNNLTATFTSTSVSTLNPTFWWDFGDGTFSQFQMPVHEYSAAQSYEVCLSITDSCTMNRTCSIVQIGIEGTNKDNYTFFEIFPTTSNGIFHIRTSDQSFKQSLDYAIYSIVGKEVFKGEVHGSTDLIQLTHLSSGLYYIRISDEIQEQVHRIEIRH